jgi:signal transduction histidine kinase
MSDAAVFFLGALVMAAAFGVLLRLGILVRRTPAGREPAGIGPELDKERRRTEAILDRMNDGVVVLDDRGRPVFANPPARRLVGLPLAALPARLPVEELATLAWRSLREGRTIEAVVEVWFPGRASLLSHAAPLEDASGVVLVIHDVTLELRTQRMRREFVTHASHELKSPVAGLQVLAEAVRAAVKDDPVAAGGFADRMATETDRLGRLIADLLDLSRLEEAGGVPETPVDLSLLVRAEVTSAGYAAERKGMSLAGDVEPGVWVRGEQSQLGLLARNLLENAVRYTPDGGSVRVTLRREEGDAVLTVVDDGIGIPLEAQSRVFERFYRVDQARTRDTGGTGLGLAIVKHITELHGGVVAVESELGRGSAFSARLPAVSPPADNVRSLAG